MVDRQTDINGQRWMVDTQTNINGQRRKVKRMNKQTMKKDG